MALGFGMCERLQDRRDHSFRVSHCGGLNAPGLEQVWLLDATGRRVLELAPQGAPTTILQVEGLAPASYFLVAVDIQGMVHNRKLIKQ